MFFGFYLATFIDKNFLYTLILKYQTYNNLPFELNLDEIKLICEELMLYISSKIPFLDTNVSINGVVQDFYSVRSKIHMSDVRILIQNFLYGSYFAIAICIFTLFKFKSIDSILYKLKKAFFKTLIAIGSVFATIIIIASINFDYFFIKFHETLFNNDLWLLDPNTDYIICLLPENIFMEYGIRISIFIIILLSLASLSLLLLSKIQLRQEAK